MRLYATMVPPPDVIAQAHAVVGVVAPAAEPTPAVEARGLFRRRRRTVTSTEPRRRAVELLPPHRIELTLAKFGNMALGDVKRLADRMEHEATEWESPRLRLSGGVAPQHGEDALWVALSGDLDALGAVRRGVTRVAESLNVYVDRRGFRPHVQIGTVDGDADPGYVQALVAALDDFESTAWWQTSLALATPVDHGPDRPQYKTFRDVTLGPAVPH